MGSKVLGKITSAGDGPRGPDVQMNLSVPEEWILAGATLEISLPRNLACAACGGGGCDACERSGAVSLRGRNDPVETIEVTLESSSVSDDVPSSRTRRIVVRIPEHGGHARTADDRTVLPRGHLLLSVRAGPPPPRGVRRLDGPSVPPAPAPDVVATTAPGRRSVERPQVPMPLLLLTGLLGLALVWWLLRR